MTATITTPPAVLAGIPAGTSALIAAYHQRMHPDHLGGSPLTVPGELLAFRRRLHEEEVQEVAAAWDAVQARPGELAAVAHLLHELADVVIVAHGTAAYLGVDLDAVIAAVMAANLRKVPSGTYTGKATKPPGWIPADTAILGIALAAAVHQ